MVQAIPESNLGLLVDDWRICPIDRPGWVYCGSCFCLPRRTAAKYHKTSKNGLPFCTCGRSSAASRAPAAAMTTQNKLEGQEELIYMHYLQKPIVLVDGWHVMRDVVRLKRALRIATEADTKFPSAKKVCRQEPIEQIFAKQSHSTHTFRSSGSTVSVGIL